MEVSTLDQEVKSSKRFPFGENWKEFLRELNEERIFEAENSLMQMLDLDIYDGKTFLDVGSGSGLFSLAARRLGLKVHSFDYDPASVWCTKELKRRFLPTESEWTIERGSVLDQGFLNKLNKYDIVYAWGVLHHTGDMWRAMKLIVPLVKPDGLLFIAIYNDQGLLSSIWRFVKHTYCRVPKFLKPFIHFPIGIIMWAPKIAQDTLKGNPLKSWWNYYRSRGMSPWRDVIDWVGGYPYEVAKPDDVISYYNHHGFSIKKVILIGRGAGNNQYVFRKSVPE